MDEIPKLLLGEPWRLSGAADRDVERVLIEVVGWRLIELERDGDQATGLVAGLQAGGISRPQLLACGLSRHAIATRLGRRALLPTGHRGVLRVGHEARPPLADEHEALLLAPRRSAVSHDSLLRIAGLPAPRSGPLHVTTSEDRARCRRGIVVHRRPLATSEVTRRFGLPTTTVLRALWDVAGDGLRGVSLEQLVGEAIAAGHVTEEQMRRSVEEREGRPGAPAMAAVLGRGAVATDSRVERLLLEGLRAAGAKGFEVHGWFGGRRPDILFRDLRIAVEVKGHHHRLSHRFEDDHDRELALRDGGLEVLPFTATKVEQELPWVVGRIMREVGRAEADLRRTGRGRHGAPGAPPS